jgi:hypothetical protein
MRYYNVTHTTCIGLLFNLFVPTGNCFLNARQRGATTDNRSPHEQKQKIGTYVLRSKIKIRVHTLVRKFHRSSLSGQTPPPPEWAISRIVDGYRHFFAQGGMTVIVPGPTENLETFPLGGRVLLFHFSLRVDEIKTFFPDFVGLSVNSFRCVLFRTHIRLLTTTLHVQYVSV